MSPAGGKPGLSGPARRRNRKLLGLAVVVCLLAVGAGGAALAPSAVTAGQHHKPKHKHKKKHKLPSRFFGTSPNGRIPTAAEFGRMKQGGIRSYRIPLVWGSVWPSFGKPLNWGKFDRQVALAAQANLNVLPFVLSTPSWLAADWRTVPTSGAQRAAFSAFLREAVKRYGPHGEFWKLHPALRYLPIRAWQIWNEENSIYFAERVSVSRYASLLKLASKTIKAADPGATVVVGGLYGRRWLPKTLSAVGFLKRLYKVKGIKSSFDAVALHPYAYNVWIMRNLIVGMRSIMKKARDARTPLWLTEFGWGSGNELTNGFDKGPQGQRKELVRAYRILIAHQRRWRIGRTYWFSWSDAPPPDCFYCTSAGLFTVDGKPKPAWYGLVGITHGKP